MKTYRVFVTRHYIDCQFFDVEALTPAKAERIAKSAAYKLRADSRAEAVDNGWIPDSVTELPRIGSAVRQMKMREFHRNKSGVAYIPEME